MSTQCHNLNKLWWAGVINATYQVSWKSVQRFQRRRFLKGFYHIWAWQPSWSCDQHHVNKFSFPCTCKLTYKIWLWLAHWFLRKASFNFFMEMTLGQGQEMTFTFNTHISSFFELVSGHRLQMFWKINNFHFFL